MADEAEMWLILLIPAGTSIVYDSNVRTLPFVE